MFQVLHLQHNRLHTILPGAFKGLVDLQEIYLQFNELTKAHSSPLPELRIIDMSGNRLRSLPELGGNKITLLNAANNPLTKLEGDYFIKRNRLQSINLSFCHLDEMSYIFSRMNLLKTLDLRGNRIKYFPNVTLPFLKKLYIGGNKIREISEEHARHIRNLTFLDMRHTNFTSIDVKFFATLNSLETFDINGSYLPCTCKMKVFGVWASTHEDILTGKIVCYWPPEAVEKCAVSTINKLDCPATKHSYSLNNSAAYIAVSVAVVLFLALVVYLIRVWRKRTSATNLEMQETGNFERFDSLSDQCGKCMSPLKCCLQARESVYSRSRMRLFSNEESEFAVSTLDKNATST